jgi:hypothetical protein
MPQPATWLHSSGKQAQNGLQAGRISLLRACH